MRNVRILKKERNALLELVHRIASETSKHIPKEVDENSLYRLLNVDLRRMSDCELGKYFTRLKTQCIDNPGYSVDERRFGLLVGSLISKYPFADPASERDRHLKTFEVFECGETLCRSTNRKFRKGITLEDAQLIAEVRTEVVALIGQSPPADVFSCGSVRHGPGATLAHTKGLSSEQKFAALPYCVSSAALNHLITMIRSSPLWLLALVDYVESLSPFKGRLLPEEAGTLDWLYDLTDLVNYNRVTSVPKDAEKNRTIAIEPLGNMLLQLRLDRVLRSRLRRKGYDLDTQIKNQQLAREGSRNGSYATIDMSMASDTVSLDIVRLLFPTEWSRILMDVRSPYADLSHFNKSSLVEYEKLSSMGNGTTFLVESVLFTAIARVSMRRNGCTEFKNLAVFGDDIVLPSHCADTVQTLLEKLGFVVNRDKSFTTGSFRESCGSEWYLGNDVKPIRQKTNINHFTELIGLHNRLLHWSAKFFGINLFPRSLEYIISLIPQAVRTFGPIDLHNVDGWIQRSEPVKRWSGYRYIPSRKRSSQNRFAMLAALCGTADSNPRTGKIAGGPYDPVPHRRICERLGLSYNLPLSISILRDMAHLTPGFTSVKRRGVWRKRTYRTVAGFPPADLLSQYKSD